MKPAAIPVAAVHILLPYLEVLDAMGAPVYRWLERFRLPYEIYHDPDAYIPARNYWKLLGWCSNKVGIDDLGIRIYGSCYDLMGRRVVDSIATSPTLLMGLEEYSRSIRSESSGTRISVSRTPRGSVRLELSKSFGLNTPGFQETEWTAVISLIKAVRLFAGPEWQPERIGVQSPGAVPALARQLFPEAHFLTAQRPTYIVFSEDFLSLGPGSYALQVRSEISPRAGGLEPRKPPADLSGSLLKVLKTYLRDGYPPLELAAEIARTSPRTLQRRLASGGLSYKKLIERARFELASELLMGTTMSSLEIAIETGYLDSSHFARAFRRMAGCSPKKYRRRHSLAA